MRKLVGIASLLVLVGGVGFYVYHHGWKLPGRIGALFSSSGDADTARKVNTALSLSKRLAGFHIDVSSSEGLVTLTGQVPSEDTKSLAGEIARDTEGVTGVNNEITVDAAAQPSSESAHVEDLEIRVAILEALNRSHELAGKNIGVKVENRVVTLSGSVETPTQRSGAEQIAGAVDGVAGVTDNLAVTNPQAATEPPSSNPAPVDSNEELANRVEFELFKTNAFDTRTLRIKSEQGRVTLSGTVRSRAEQLLAERVAQVVPGVKKVSNELKIAVPTANTR